MYERMTYIHLAYTSGMTVSQYSLYLREVDTTFVTQLKVKRHKFSLQYAQRLIDVGLINVYNVYQKFVINAFVIFVNVSYFNKCHMKCRKSFVE